MEMIKSNDNYNFNIHHESQSTSKVSICNLVKQLKPSSSNLLPRAKGRSKENQSSETRPIQRKKQVRRRAHTTKPHQERLLNMAEARKEIVSALKLHRASMKKQQQQQTVTIPALIHQIPPEQQLPTFKAIATHDCYTKPSLDHPATLVEPTALQVDQENAFASNISNGQCQGGAAEPRALDEEEMAEIRSIGEMHQMEWDDTLNFATYALWFKFLHEMDLSEQDDHSVCVLNQSCDRIS